MLYEYEISTDNSGGEVPIGAAGSNNEIIIGVQSPELTRKARSLYWGSHWAAPMHFELSITNFGETEGQVYGYMLTGPEPPDIETAKQMAQPVTDPPLCMIYVSFYGVTSANVKLNPEFVEIVDELGDIAIDLLIHSAFG